MNKSKVLLILLFLFGIQSVPSAQTENPRPIIEIKGPRWMSGGQSVVTCKRIGDNENCVAVAVPKELGEMVGILRLRPLRNATTSWLAFTKKAIAVCSMQISNKKIACAEVDAIHDGLPLYFPATREQLQDTVASYAKFQPAFIAAGNRVGKELSGSAKKVADGMYTMAGEEGGCDDECVEDMPIVYVDAPGGGGGSGEWRLG